MGLQHIQSAILQKQHRSRLYFTCLHTAQQNLHAAFQNQHMAQQNHAPLLVVQKPAPLHHLQQQ